MPSPMVAVVAAWMLSTIAAPAVPGQLVNDGCPVTLPNGVAPGLTQRDPTSYGNTLFSVIGLWPNATIIFKPDGPGFITDDGALGMKFGWRKGVRGAIRVSGHRTDAGAPPLRFDAPSGYGDIGFQASALIFSTPGCWQVEAQIGDIEASKLTFVTRVVKIGDGPSSQRSGRER